MSNNDLCVTEKSQTNETTFCTPRCRSHDKACTASELLTRPVDATGWRLAIDGSNFAYSGTGSPDLYRLRRIVYRLVALIDGVKPFIYFDASLQYALPKQ